MSAKEPSSGAETSGAGGGSPRAWRRRARARPRAVAARAAVRGPLAAVAAPLAGAIARGAGRPAAGRGRRARRGSAPAPPGAGSSATPLPERPRISCGVAADASAARAAPPAAARWCTPGCGRLHVALADDDRALRLQASSPRTCGRLIADARCLAYEWRDARTARGRLPLARRRWRPPPRRLGALAAAAIGRPGGRLPVRPRRPGPRRRRTTVSRTSPAPSCTRRAGQGSAASLPAAPASSRRRSRSRPPSRRSTPSSGGRPSSSGARGVVDRFFF